MPRALGLVLLLAVAAGAPAGAGAQSTSELARLALAWLVGDWVAPMVCQIDGQPRRALRRVKMAANRDEAQPSVRLFFPDPDAPGATRCFSELGHDESQVAGALQLGFEAHASSDMGQREFQEALERERGFEYPIRSGRLRIAGWGPNAMAEAKSVDFTGGRAIAHVVSRGDDAARLLRELRAARGITLELTAPDGTRLFFPLAAAPPR